MHFGVVGFITPIIREVFFLHNLNISYSLCFLLGGAITVGYFIPLSIGTIVVNEIREKKEVAKQKNNLKNENDGNKKVNSISFTKSMGKEYDKAKIEKDKVDNSITRDEQLSNLRSLKKELLEKDVIQDEKEKGKNR